MMWSRYVDFCIMKFCMLITYQDQEAIVADNIPLPVLHPAPYPPAGQPFLEVNIQYINLGTTRLINN